MCLLLPWTATPPTCAATLISSTHIHRTALQCQVMPAKLTISASLLSSPARSVVKIGHYLMAEFSNGKWQGYLVALAPVTIAAGVSNQLCIGMEKEIQVAVLRSFVQLLTVGFILQLIIEGGHLLLGVFGIVAMVLLAGHTAGEQAKPLPMSKLVATAALALGVSWSVGLVILLQVFPAEPRIVIPVTSQVLGNAMIMVGGTLKTLQYEISRFRGQIEAALSLGATPQNAVENHIERAFTLGMGPMIDAIKVTGLVSLPGNMTGLLMGGAMPLEAIKVQVKVMNITLGAAAISSLISALFGWNMLFTRTFQLHEN